MTENSVKKSDEVAYNNVSLGIEPECEKAIFETEYKKKKEKLNVTCSLAEMFNRVKNEPKIPMLYPAIKEGSVGLIYGVAKTGKTIFCENLGMSIAAGRKEFLGKEINSSSKKVLFISMEEAYQGRTERNMKQFESFNDEEKESVLANYIVANENVPKIITSNEDWNIVENAIVENEAKIVFMDSLTRMVDGQIENADIARFTMLKIRELADKLKITLIMIHHSTKMNEDQPMTLQNVAGSRVISQEADFIIGINKTSSNVRYSKLVAARYANDNNSTVEKFELDENLWVNVNGNAEEHQILNPTFDKRRSDHSLGLILDKLKELNGENELIDAKLLTESLVINKMISEPTLYANLKKGTALGRIINPEKGKYGLAVIN
ncbi:hypothetical protein ASE92_17330 [Pedobacter sp. Leaf41]|uniref:AAA family ATPase n=1 Tax=Pedobacter sp. Leaf41 TaxID=1736218 RepID=UPI0007037E01|nr:AAA family ATPase [Pedobacter sp. Leaf41]KQN32368.1 hypothetical protein ASE92_17330 [Pedobacter sp. Leaf41]